MHALDASGGPSHGPGPGWRTGLALGALVVLAHLALLQDRVWLGWPSSPAPRLDTRLITIPPPGPDPALAAPVKRLAPAAVPAPVQPGRTSAPPLVVPDVTAAAPVTATMPTPSPLPATAAADTAAPPASPPASAPVAIPTQPPATTPPATAPVTAAAAPQPEPEPVAPARPPREAALSTGAVLVPPSARLRYRVEANKFPYSLNAELLWRQDGMHYDARLSMGAFGQSRVQTSRGDIGPQGLLPTRFSDKYRSEVAAHFERDKGRISFSANTPDVPLLTGAQDYLSVMLQLAAMIAGEPERYPVATTLTLQIAGPRDAEVWLFTVERPETLVLPGGEQNTIKLLRHPRRPFDQQVELWFAPALAYLPVRLRISEANGDYLDQKWTGTDAPS